MMRRQTPSVIAFAIAIGLALTACASSSSSAGSASAGSQSKGLSLSTVTVAGFEGSVNWASLWAAQAEGFYAKQGLTVKFVNTQASASSMVAGVIGNSYQFIAADPVGLPPAVQNGAQIKAVLTPDVGPTDDLVISQQAAAEHHIPASGTVAQLKALAGSHFTIGVVSLTAASYLDLLAVLKAQGLTASTGSGSDITIQSVGPLNDEVAGLATGHLDGFVNIYPNTDVPDSVHIMYGSIAPVSMEPPLTFTTSDSLIKAHPDTVQAFVTATVEGWEYTRQHPSQTKQIDSKVFPTVGVTDAAKINVLYQLDQQHRGSTPAITGGEYQAIQSVLQAAGTPTTVSYNDFVDSSFVNKAITQLKLGVPTGTAG
jgi:ABC-type nitrate/sulfonate/bicarbonate transport system substrate-binding protein